MLMLEKLQALLTIHFGEKPDGPIPSWIFGEFLEHLWRECHGSLILRIANPLPAFIDPPGKVEIKLRRHLRRSHWGRRVGECLTLDAYEIRGVETHKIHSRFSLDNDRLFR